MRALIENNMKLLIEEKLIRTDVVDRAMVNLGGQ